MFDGLIIFIILRHMFLKLNVDIKIQENNDKFCIIRLVSSLLIMLVLVNILANMYSLFDRQLSCTRLSICYHVQIPCVLRNVGLQWINCGTIVNVLRVVHSKVYLIVQLSLFEFHRRKLFALSVGSTLCVGK